MRRLRKKKSQFIIGIISTIVLVLTIGYSFLSAHLMIGGLAHITVYWDVHFDNVVVNSDSVSLGTGDYAPTIDANDSTKLDYKVTLSNPGDFYEFTVDAVNDGSIDAMINEITPKINNQDISNLPTYLTYSLSYSDDVLIEENQILNAHSTETIKVRLEVNETNSNLPESFEMSFEEEYVKADENAERVKHPMPLYSILENEANSGSGLALKYTGQHKDSFTEQASKDIYYWYASNSTNGNVIQEKRNVVFAGHCWQMIRTTDTGGVKMIYNGEAVDNQCLSTRGTHVGYASRTSQNLASNYWYGTDYTYDSAAKTFKVSGTTEQTTWNATTGPGLVGKYTCKLTSVDGTCATLYLVESYYNTTSAYVIPLNSYSNYSQFGNLQFNAINNSPAYAGYKYGDVYPYSRIESTDDHLFKLDEDALTYDIFDNTYLYSETISCSNDMCSLDNPVTLPSYKSPVGYYTFRSATTTRSSAPLYYLVGSGGSSGSVRYYYYVRPSATVPLASFNIMIGDSITDNNDGTFTLNNAITVTPEDWYNYRADYNNYYTCGDTNITCSNPRYLVDTTYPTNYSYINIEKLVLGKARNGLSLMNTILVRTDDIYSNYGDYFDYKYTCGNTDTTCNEENLKMVTSYSQSSYTYIQNRYFGSSVTWDGTNYTLVDPIGIENYNDLDNLSTHHYMCISNGLKTCATVAYLYYFAGIDDSFNYMHYITLENGITTVDKVREDMFTKNTTNSTIKTGIDAWYKHFLYNDYDQYIEDTIFCNDRSFYDLGGWDADGGLTPDTLQFKEYTSTTDFSCANITDQFSVSNSNAQLTYKVGLMSYPEMLILGNSNARNTGQSYWLASPMNFYTISTSGRIVGYSTSTYDDISNSNGVRPAISLGDNAKYRDGDGSKANPYIVITE